MILGARRDVARDHVFSSCAGSYERLLLPLVTFF